MPPRLPQASGRDVIRLLERLGYEFVRQRGSHIRVRKVTPAGTHNITVPVHRTIAQGTLNSILSDVSVWNGIPKDELIEQLR
ncbi:type II toxin-antitoxin system HicA family toxin [bacterium]|nr:type II toxin-antitoxin system HicA family toxin [bacterium]